jgi:hypothetical protein
MKPLKIAFVPTAGALKFGYWARSGKQVPCWMTWPIFKALLKLYVKRGRILLFHLDCLKLETVAKLIEAAKLYLEGYINTIFLSGGQTGKRKKDSVELMKEFLLECGIAEEDIFLDRTTLQSSEKVLSLINFVKDVYEQDNYVELVIPVLSWYNWSRFDYHLNKHRSNWLNNVVAKYWLVYSPLSMLCIKYEYLYNIIAEPLKLYCMLFPRVQIWWRAREEKLRDIR